MSVGARGDAIVGAHARAVIKEEVIVVYSGVQEKLADHARALLEAAVGAMHLAEQAQEQFSVEVLADLVGEGDVLGNGDRNARGQHLAVEQRRGNGGQAGAGELEGLGALIGKVLSRSGEPVTGDGIAADLDAAAEERLPEGCGGKGSGVFDGEIGMEAIGRHSAPCAEGAVAGTPVELGLGGLACKRGRRGVVERVVVYVRCPLGGGFGWGGPGG